MNKVIIAKIDSTHCLVTDKYDYKFAIHKSKAPSRLCPDYDSIEPISELEAYKFNVKSAVNFLKSMTVYWDDPRFDGDDELNRDLLLVIDLLEDLEPEMIQDSGSIE